MSDYVKSSIQRLKAYVPGEQPSDRTVVKLNTNENPYPVSPEALRALAEISAEDIRRYPDPLCSALREHIAGMHSCGPDNVFIGNGSDEILSLCVGAFVEPSSAISFFEPSYSLYPVLAAIRDIACVPVKLGPMFEWREPYVSGASLFFIGNPNAPTGVLYPKKEIAAFCRRFEGVVVIDEAYVDFSSENCIDLAVEFKNVLVLRTMSKSFSLAGARLGYAVADEQLIQALLKIKDSYNVNALTQKIALAALSDTDYHREIITKIKTTRESLTKRLKEKGFFVVPSEANFVWAKPEEMPAGDVFRKLRERNIYVRYFPGELTGEYIRITVGTDEQIDKLFEALESILA